MRTLDAIQLLATSMQGRAALDLLLTIAHINATLGDEERECLASLLRDAAHSPRDFNLVGQAIKERGGR